MRRKIARTTFITAVSAGLAMMSTAAHASNADSYSQELRSHATFTADGEILKVKDIYKDGRSALVQIRYSNELKTYWNPNGVDTTRTIDLNLAEGTTVSIRACSGEYDGYVIYVEECGYWKGATA